jgi:hypothetical protein
LENARHILSAWCRNPALRGIERDVGGLRADEWLDSLGEPNPLKLWQVARMVDKITHALDARHPYHNLALPDQEGNAPAANGGTGQSTDDSRFLQQTRNVLIHDTVDGRESQISLAFAIDLLMPCGWDFAGCLDTILKAIGGNLHPQRPLACCARNVRLSPLCGRLRTISDTLHVFWAGSPETEIVDSRLRVSLGEPTPVKQWLAASLDKTVRLHLDQPFEMDLF